MTTAPGLAKPSCPRCGGSVIYDLACHTYGQGDKWYACMPCDSAIRYICDGNALDDEDDGCGWEYTHGFNPRNPRAAANEETRPPWLPHQEPDRDRHGNIKAIPGCRMLGTDMVSA